MNHARRGVPRVFVLLFVFMGFCPPAHASLGAVSPETHEEYSVTASTPLWATAPSNAYRLFFDLYNINDAFDSEPGNAKQFPDLTELTDTARLVATLLWNERFRFQGGVIAQQTYGRSPGFGSVDPWIQVLWQPTQSLSAILGDLSIPHDYLPAIFYPENYFLESNTETGLQLLNRRPGWNDDFYFNYRQADTASENEKFDFGFTHHNEWKWLYLTYQAHWIHSGGTNYPHTFNTINDVAQTVGAGLKFHPLPPLILGADYYYLHSHYRTDTDTLSLQETINGDGHYVEGYVRWSRLKVTFGDWHGSDYFHEGGDPYFTVPLMQNVIAHWDILLSQDFNLFGEATAYFIGNNELNISRYVKSTFWIEAAWHFSFPQNGWSAGPRESDASTPVRWDNGI